MNLLIIDVETSGIDPLKDKVVEVGAILYNVNCRATLTQVSYVTPNVSFNECENINRIPKSSVDYVGTDFEIAHSLGKELYRRADYMVAHNAEFDKSFLPEFSAKPWLCTCFDFKWPQASRDGGSLISLALDHGIGVSSAHRALTDCQLIAALFDRMENLPEMIAHAARPKGIFQAKVSFDQKDLAKDAGFKWNPDTKQWLRRMAVADAQELSFPVVKVDECR